MEPKNYVVTRIEGEYAYLREENTDNEEIFIALLKSLKKSRPKQVLIQEVQFLVMFSAVVHQACETEL